MLSPSARHSVQPSFGLKIFNILIQRNGYVSSKELSEVVRADHLLLIRLTRFLRHYTRH